LNELQEEENKKAVKKLVAVIVDWRCNVTIGVRRRRKD
jgi:hypothetical protein